MKNVHELLEKQTAKFNYISSKATVLEALVLMKVANVSYVIVTDDDQYKGIVCEKDCLHKIALNGLCPEKTFVKDILIKDFPIVEPEDSTERCMELMNSFQILYLPVFKGHKFLGVLSIYDILKETAEEQHLKYNEDYTYA
ncbi:MAG: CBS domain-containing protein [Hydrotalea sp. AMD]|uniref:CBS domain-containing protein n=1 Tax=Hydrotalea sp. AMD TaxID=2501297 RepID=UPI0009454B76|nr:CBS domain-containing protein [Hydrotalea sp. AMD]RWZ89801.1 MAG: CBS domain-containing protein [Hydrotalea sp. AMD]